MQEELTNKRFPLVIWCSRSYVEKCLEIQILSHRWKQPLFSEETHALASTIATTPHMGPKSLFFFKFLNWISISDVNDWIFLYLGALNFLLQRNKWLYFILINFHLTNICTMDWVTMLGVQIYLLLNHWTNQKMLLSGPFTFYLAWECPCAHFFWR